MNFPTNCSNCGFRNRCNAAMYTNGCHFFAPEDKLKAKESGLKMLFNKIFT